MQNKDINYLTAGYEIKQNTNAHQLQYLESKLYLGRSLSDMIRERYANAVFERLDIWNARKQYLEIHNIVRTDRNSGSPVVPDIRRTPAPDIIVRAPITRAPPIVIRPAFGADTKTVTSLIRFMTLQQV
jgi:hypothetical protein